jgi:hypothetical protein
MFDGFGIPESGWDNSVYSEFCSKKFVDFFKDNSIPIDACLGVEGLPQSATGQTALFTGYNGADIMGEHMAGFPGPLLRDAIRDRNIFSSLELANYTVTFANAYVRYSIAELRKTRFRSVTTIMTEGIFGAVRRKADLIDHYAVYHDITRKSLQGGDVGIGRQKFKMEPPIPDVITPEQGALDLLKVSAPYDFTLFEYFMTDKVGHGGDISEIKAVLEDIDRFVCALQDNMCRDTILVISSDHGNIEDPTTKKHTYNPVPFLVYGKNAPGNLKLESLLDVHSFIIKMMIDLNNPDKDVPEDSNDHFESESFGSHNPFFNIEF